MSQDLSEQNMFWGRVYNSDTNTWNFRDGSRAPVPDELMPKAGDNVLVAIRRIEGIARKL